MKIRRVRGWVLVDCTYMGVSIEQMRFEDFRWPQVAGHVIYNIMCWQQERRVSLTKGGYRA